MPFHTLAYVSTSTIAPSGYMDIPAVDDQIVTVVRQHYVLPADMKLLMAFASGPYARLQTARVNGPSLRHLSPTSIVPVHLCNTDLNDPNVMVLSSPLTLRGMEEIALEAQYSPTLAPGQQITGLLWLAEDDEVAPAVTRGATQGDRWLRFTSPSGVLLQPSATAWTPAGPYVFDVGTLPVGRYAVTGLSFLHPGALCARLVFDLQRLRPGALAVNSASPDINSAEPFSGFVDGSLGIWGTFVSSSPPRIEVLGVGTAAASAFTGFLRIAQIDG